MSDTSEVRKLLGKCFFIGFAGLEVPPSIAKFIRENSIGGVSLFANNYESPAQVAELINSLQALRPAEDPPLAIAVDHEGGKVQRFRKPFTHFPEPRVIGDEDSPKLAFDCAQIQAKELKAVGVNVTYAPLADIHTNPANPVIGRRAFGDTEERVSKMVSAYVRGYLTAGVQPVVKHFPGHGDTSKDSHFHLPKVDTPLETLMRREFRPFLKAFKAHCALVMTAHIVVESVDPGVPATLSKKILRDILRGELRYRGLVISDDMEMKAIADHFGEDDAPLRALEAGCDILLYHTEPFQTRAFEKLMSRLTSPAGGAALESLRASAAKVDEFRRKSFMPYKPVYVPEIASIVGAAEHVAVAGKLQSQA